MTTSLNKSQQLYSLCSPQQFASTAPACALPQLHDEDDDGDDAEKSLVLTRHQFVSCA